MRAIQNTLCRWLSCLLPQAGAIRFSASKLMLTLLAFPFFYMHVSDAKAAENVVVNVSGGVVYGQASRMQLWIDGSMVAAVDVPQTTATDFTFPVNLPVSGQTNIDVVFTNDACCWGGDRNLYVYSVLVRGATLLPTDAGVIIDRGQGAAAFDGVDTVPGQTGLWWNGAVRFSTALSPRIVASFYMNEASWTGANGEVVDSAGSYSGVAAGLAATKPTTALTTSAIVGSPGTCRYGLFNRSNKDHILLPNSFPNLGADGDNFTITAWIKTTNNTLPGQRVFVDDEHNNSGYGFSLGDGGTGRLRLFSRSTPSALILDTSNVIANDTWYFVAAEVDVGNKTNHIYVYSQSGALLTHVNRTWTEGSFGFDAGAASIGAETNASGERYSAFGFSGNIDEINVLKGALSSAELDDIRQQTHVCPVSNNVAADFNCVSIGGTPNTGHLLTQISGGSFNFEVVALKSNGDVETDFVTTGTKEVVLEFVDGSGATMCASRSTLNPAVSQVVSLNSVDAGRKTVSVTINKAYRDLRCRITDTNQSPSVVGCSSDNFSVRPGSFTVSAGGGVNADGAGLSETATPTAKAGSSFALNAVTNTVGYDGSPNIDTTKLSAHIGASQTGTLSGVFGAAIASSGTATGVAFTYDEVGYFRLGSYGVYDSTFTTVDAVNGDCTVGFSASGGKHACSFGNVPATSYFGRFIPDHFSINAGTTTPACNTGFTYYGQDGFTTPFTITAQNATNTTTQNYTGSFAKLNLTAWNDYRFTAATLPAGSLLSASSTLPTGTWGNGVANVLSSHQISRPTSPAPAMGIVINAAPVDVDGVTMPSAAVANQSDFRYGRLSIANAYGSELLPLTQMVEAEYWNGVTYVRNQLDSCTAIETSSIAMTNYKSNLSACETSVVGGGVMDGGKVDIKLTAPGNGNNGGVDLSVNLNGASGTTCIPNSAIATSADMPWFGANPSAHATFGLYKSPVLYMRENF